MSYFKTRGLNYILVIRTFRLFCECELQAWIMKFGWEFPQFELSFSNLPLSNSTQLEMLGQLPYRESTFGRGYDVTMELADQFKIVEKWHQVRSEIIYGKIKRKKITLLAHQHNEVQNFYRIHKALKIVERVSRNVFAVVSV